MDIVKAFNSNDLHTEIIIKGTVNDPLFRASGQYDAQGNLVRVHACKYDCIRTLKMSDKTLFKALSKNVEYNGFYFKPIGEKLKC